MKVITVNKKAGFNYQIFERFEAGIVLKGSEVKSIREGNINLKDGYCIMKADELYLINVHISRYKPSGVLNHEPERARKMLLHKRELKRLTGKINERGLSIIPLKVYINQKGRIKVEIGLAKGKSKIDKREDLRKRAIDREIERELKY
ncbi:MAG: SsrA-binding protein SmpB [Candidatus Hydrogenedentota bacterium]